MIKASNCTIYGHFTHFYTLSKVENEDTKVILGGSGHWRPEVHVGKDAGRLAEVVLIPSVVLTHEMITLASSLTLNTHLVEAEGLPPLVLGLADGGLVGEPGHGAARPSRPQQQQLQLGLNRTGDVRQAENNLRWKARCCCTWRHVSKLVTSSPPTL